jgi:hypothetical protein
MRATLAMMSLLAFMQRLPTSTPWPRQCLVGGDQLGAANVADDLDK